MPSAEAAPPTFPSRSGCRAAATMPRARNATDLTEAKRDAARSARRDAGARRRSARMPARRRAAAATRLGAVHLPAPAPSVSGYWPLGGRVRHPAAAAQRLHDARPPDRPAGRGRHAASRCSSGAGRPATTLVHGRLQRPMPPPRGAPRSSPTCCSCRCSPSTATAIASAMAAASTTARWRRCARGGAMLWRSASPSPAQEVADVPRERLRSAARLDRHRARRAISSPEAQIGTRMRMLFCGDIVGRSGREAVVERPAEPAPRARRSISSSSTARTPPAASASPRRSAASSTPPASTCITTGNHVWDQREIDRLHRRDPRLLRPVNFPTGTPGRGLGVYHTPTRASSVLVVNLMGRLFMDPLDDPFAAARARCSAQHRLGGSVDAIIVDFHAEATSEKMAFGHFVDGRVSLVVGTHTHVPTADTRSCPAAPPIRPMPACAATTIR